MYLTLQRTTGLWLCQEKKISRVENVGKYSAGKVKSTLAVSNPYCSMIEFGSVHGSQEPQV
jgi:hypothetical protein